MEEIASIAQIINIMFQGISMSLKVGKEALNMGERCLKLFGNMALAPIKGAAKAYTWAKYHKETGSTNLKNLYTRSRGDITYLKLDAEMFKEMKKYFKKSGVLYTAVPPFKGGNKDSVHLMVSSADMPRISAILEEFKKYYMEKQSKHGMSREEAEKTFKKKNSVETADEMMQDIGAMGDFDDFMNQVETIFGKDYTADMVREESIYYADEKLGFSKVPGWVPAAEVEEKLNELARIIKEQQNLEGVNTVGISFEHNPNDPENSHIVGQTEDYIKVQLNERGKACVMIPKEYVHGDMAKESPDGKFTAHIPEDMELLVVDMDEKSAAVSMTAKDFVERYKDWEKQAVENLGEKINAGRKNMDRYSRSVTGKELYQKYDSVSLNKKQSFQAAQQKFEMGGKKAR